jgi:hypothetical protein
VDFDKIIQRYDQRIAQTLLAQFIFLGLSEFGTQSLAVRITDFFSQTVEGWLRAIAQTLNRFAVPQLFKMNTFSVLSGLPQFDIGSVGQVDIMSIMEAVSFAVGAGALEPDEGVERKIRQMLEFAQRGTPEGGDLLADIAPEPKFPTGPFGVPQPGNPKLAKEIEKKPEDMSATHRLILERLLAGAEEALTDA